MSIKEAIEQLRTYESELGLTLHEGADEFRFILLENAYNITLPDDFKVLYRFTDGFETVEDMFNMIPLDEIIDNKNRHNGDPLYIAEYMIYSDMWQLEINQDDQNDYKIIVESNYNKLVLTHSLAEFIGRFLKGGVFGPGGLQDWQEEVELQPVYSTKIKTAESLLAVFYYGLRYDIISKKEIVDWADRIVMHEDEPDIFFIELSLSHDKNELISLLHSRCVPDNHTTARAMLALLYHRLIDGAIDVDKVIAIMNKHNFTNLLTRTETENIYAFTDEIWMNDSIDDDNELTQNVLNFLEMYKEFEIGNFKHWLGSSYRVEYRISEDEKKPKQSYDVPANKIDINIWMIYGIVYGSALISFAVIITTYNMVENKMPLGKFRSDLYQLSRLYFFFFICYYILKAGKWMVKKIVAGFKKVVR
jgi:hypothetical protein